MMTKHGAGKIKTVTTGLNGQSVEVGDDAAVIGIDKKKVSVKIGTSVISVQADDDELEAIKMMRGKKLAAYMIERVTHE